MIIDEGKLPYNILEKIIRRFSFSDNTMIKGPGIGLDCAVFDNGSDFIVVTSDPVTYVASGEYCVNVNVNDIAAMGGEPWFFLCTIILPVGFEEKIFEGIMDEIKKECERFKINFGGGHTEINKIVKSPVICGFMVGKCKKEELRGSFNAKDGDILIAASDSVRRRAKGSSHPFPPSSPGSVRSVSMRCGGNTVREMQGGPAYKRCRRAP